MRPSAGAVRARASSVGGQAALLGVGYLCRSIGTLALAVLIGHRLGADTYGQVGAFLALTWGCYYVTSSWALIALPAVSVANSRKAFSAEFFWAASAVALTCTAAGCAFLAALAVVVPDVARDVLDDRFWLAVPPTVLALLVLNQVYALLQTTNLAARVAFMQGAERIVAVVFTLVALAAVGEDVGGVAWGLAAASVVTAVGAALLPSVRRLAGRARLSRAALNVTVGSSWPLAVINVCAYAVGWAGILFVSLLSTDAEAGAFTLAFQLYSVPVALASVWVYAAVPAYAAKAGSEHSARPDVRDVERTTLAWAGLMLVAAALAVPLFDVVFGTRFDAAVGLLAVLLTGVCLMPFYYAVVPVFIVGPRVRELMWLTLAGAVLNIAIDLLLTPSWGAWAVAVGTAAQTFVVTIWIAVAAYGPEGLRRLATVTLAPIAALALIAVEPRSNAAAAVAGLVGVLALAATAVQMSRRTPVGVGRHA